MLPQRRIRLATVALGLLLSSVSVSCSSAAPPVHPWFTEHLTIRPTALPEGVSADVVPNGTYNYPAEYLVITNTSDMFLYLSTIKQPNTGSFVAAPVQLRSGGIPAVRVRSGKAYVWDEFWTGRGWEVGWNAVDQYSASAPLRLYISGNGLVAQTHGIFTYDLAEYEWRNKFDYGGGRPPNVQLPSPHHIALTMDYGDQQVVLPLTISYTLNEHYPAENTQRNYSRDIVVAVVLLAAVAFLGLKFVMTVAAQTSRGL